MQAALEFFKEFQKTDKRIMTSDEDAYLCSN
jgi:hypothetical protein